MQSPSTVSLLWAANLLVLATANKEPRLSYHKDTITGCSFWYDNIGTRTCESIRTAWGISPETFSRWNPPISLDCQGWARHSYCVAVAAEETSTTITPTSSTISSTTSATPSKSPVWTELGCYKDASTHPLATQLASSGGNSLTRSKCEIACWEAAFHYSGFKSGTECWCGTYVFGDLASNATDCNVPCSGNNTETCGASNLFNIMKGGIPYNQITTTSAPINTAPSTPSSTQISIPLPTQTEAWDALACYKDTAPTNDRTLKEYQSISTGQLTVETCRSQCLLRNFIYSGVENGEECWCGDEIQVPSANTEVALSECSKKCPGNSDQNCGNIARIYVSKYALKSISSNVAYYDDFGAGNMIHWRVIDGAYSASTKAMVATSSSGGKAILRGSESYSDFLYEFDITIPSSDGNAGVVFRVSDPGPGADQYTGYYAGIATSGSVVFGRASNSWTQLQFGNAEIKPDVKHHVKVRAVGGTLDLFVDDMTTPKITTSDTTYTRGSVGSRVYNTGAMFNNVQISPLLFSEDFSDSTALEKWTIYDGSFAVGFGVLVPTAPGKGFISGTQFKDFIFEADFTVNSGSLGLLFRVSNPHEGPYGYNGYFAGISEGLVVVSRSDNNWNELQNAQVNIKNGEVHHVLVKMRGDSILVYVDDMNTPKLNVKDSTYGVGLNGIGVLRQSGYIDNVKIYAI